MLTYENLRARYPVFEYTSFSITDENGACRVTYRFDQGEGIVFTPSWLIPCAYETYASDPFFRAAVFHLGLVELISYWKACCSPTVRIRCGSLDEKRTAWWKKLWFNGLGEFFYRNHIKTDISSFMTVETEGEPYTVHTERPLGGHLICVGGGKDSCVTMDLLKAYDNTLFAVNGSPAIFRTARAAGYDDEKMTVFSRRLDRKIVELNAAGYLNGHTPFSAILAFSALIAAYVGGRRYIVLSNESSANDVYVKGTDVNHQYSKSFAFENDFRAYTKEYLDAGIDYFSLLRPLNEWNIVKRFVRHPAFLDAFLSCNLGTKNDRWCNDCPKCLFTFIMLSAFLDKEKVVAVFGEDLLDKEAMLPYLDGLCSEQFDKPFECIGTREEINAAMRAAIARRGADALLLRAYEKKYADPDADDSAVDGFFDENNHVPDYLREVLGWNRN